MHTNVIHHARTVPTYEPAIAAGWDSRGTFAVAPARATPSASVVHALQQVSLLQGLTEAELEWLSTHGRERVGLDHCTVFQEDEPSHHLIIVLSGEIHVHRRRAGGIALFVGRTAQITGKLPYSRMEAWRGDGSSPGFLWVLEIHEACFPAMLLAIPSMAQRCVSILLERVRDFTRADLQTEKLAALGRLAASVSHELNNPASAAQRAGADLTATIDSCETYLALGRAFPSEADLARFVEWLRLASRATSIASSACLPGEALELDLESHIHDWLQRFGVPKPWSLAPVLAEANVSVGMLNKLPGILDLRYVPAAIEAACSFLASRRAARTVVETTSRIFKVVSAVKDYSYMDRAQLQQVDLVASVENALSLLQRHLARVEVQRDYDLAVPLVSAYGAELSQVWTALLENAIYAMQGEGILCVRTRVSGRLACVEFWDDGDGIDPAISPLVFEPFFTTKPVGDGLGLGLDLVRRIVEKHFGSVTLQALPDRTCFEVRLPIDSPHVF